MAFTTCLDEYVGFFGKQHPFSNFHPHHLTYETEELDQFGNPTDKKMLLNFQTSEALYQWKKVFSNPIVNKCFKVSKTSPPDGYICESIRKAITPKQCKYIGRKAIVDFDSFNLSKRIEVMREVVSLKFSPIPLSHPSMPRDWNPSITYKFTGQVHPSVQLICSGNSVIVELSPYDKIWGVGKNRKTFIRWLTQQSVMKATSYKRVLSSIFTFPVKSDPLDVLNIGMNLLGRILMEQREKLKSINLVILKPISECCNNILNKRKKQKKN